MSVTLSPRAVRHYYDTLEDLRARGIVNEMGLRQAFQRLLEDCLPAGWRLVPEQALANCAPVRDGSGVPPGSRGTEPTVIRL